MVSHQQCVASNQEPASPAKNSLVGETTVKHRNGQQLTTHHTLMQHDKPSNHDRLEWYNSFFVVIVNLFLMFLGFSSKNMCVSQLWALSAFVG